MTDTDQSDKAFLASLPDDLLAKLKAVSSEAQRHAMLDTHLAAQKAESRERFRRNQEAFRDLHTSRFTFDWQAALVGSPTAVYIFKVLNVEFHLRPPAASHTRALLAALDKDEAAAVKPVRPAEIAVLGWALALRAGQGDVIPMAAHGDVLAQLTKLRALPDITLERVAAEIDTLQSWLNVQLDLDAGKS